MSANEYRNEIIVYLKKTADFDFLKLIYSMIHFRKKSADFIAEVKK